MLPEDQSALETGENEIKIHWGAYLFCVLSRQVALLILSYNEAALAGRLISDSRY